MSDRALNALAWMLIGFLVAVMIMGCSSVNQKTVTGPLYKYRADIQITVDGKTFDGMAATAAAHPKQIQLVSKVPLDRLQITSCARNEVHESIDASWFGGAGKTYVYQYSPTAVEEEGMCPLYIEAFSKDSLTAWGFVGFRSEEKMPAHIDCNGEGWTWSGVTVCQTKAGLQQRMTFFSKVTDAEAEPGCHMVKVNDRTYDFVPDLGFCRATFFDGKDGWHRMVLLGYGDVLTRVQ